MFNHYEKLIRLYSTKNSNTTYIKNIIKKLQNIKLISSLKTNKKMFKSAVFNLQQATKDQVQEYIHSFDTVLTDCDGVLWFLNNNPIPGSVETINYFRELGKKIYYITNNSTKTRDDVVKKGKEFGYEISQEEVLSSAYLVACYLNGINFREKVYIVGPNSIAEELKAVGIRHLNVGPDPMTNEDYRSMKPELDPDVGAVVVGFDVHISYPKLMKAASYLSSDKCLFIGTNCDEQIVDSNSIVLPTACALVRAIETCSKRQAIILGKPNSYIRQYIESYGLNPSRTLMIGDSCTTDIEFGVRCGFQTLLVLTGVTTAKDVERILTEKIPPLPDVFLTKLGDLLSLVSS